ncbi:hypothetical protein BLNAU_17121 [Blattamonas nauphoetae]|uniref:Uncharacterized protein n=1 Tax=Blattamonas nauphoetae TaxID=2049346 RepID=A0ABQ9X931_9EUKA|nr:hypothetical protein BLNAU_17121 [Blattamonas nauphoetae]
MAGKACTCCLAAFSSSVIRINDNAFDPNKHDPISVKVVLSELADEEIPWTSLHSFTSIGIHLSGEVLVGGSVGGRVNGWKEGPEL